VNRSSSAHTNERLGKVMAALPNTMAFSQNHDRRSFLRSLAALGLAAKTRKSEKPSEPVYRFLTPACEVRMTVQYFDSSSIKGFRFRDRLTNHGFCLSAAGEQNGVCLERFVGSLAIDSRISPRPPFERALPVEREVVSDIQAFGYNPDDAEQAASYAKPFTLWSLLRQDLYLNDQAKAFLIVHWKHTLDLISLVDVIPGDGTQVVGE
jgi:hypothetical protein